MEGIYTKEGSSDTETLVLKTEEDHPYLGIYIQEWGDTNMHLLKQLLTSGLLKRGNVKFCLAYTTKIYKFTELID